MPTQLNAYIEKNVIRCFYKHLVPNDQNPDKSDLTIQLHHRYRSHNNAPYQTLILNTIEIPSSSIQSYGLPGADLTYQADIVLVNPVYSKDLFITLTESHNSVTTTTNSEVLEDPSGPVVISNPIKHEEHSENEPIYKPTKPNDNVSIPMPEINPIVYDLSRDGLQMVQSGARIVLNSNIFSNINTNVYPGVFLSENGINNLAFNPSFSGLNSITGWEVYAPGMVIATKRIPGDIESTNVFVVKINNTNPFNAFTDVSIRQTELVAYPTGANWLCTSIYYTLANQLQQLPCQTIRINLNFYNSEMEVIHDHEILWPAILSPREWQRISLVVPLSTVPPTVEYFNWQIDLVDVLSNTPTIFSLYLPQIELNHIPTSNTLTYRVLDKYRTQTNVQVKSPMYFRLKTTHHKYSSIRGLFDSTVEGKNGVRGYVSGEQLYFQVLDNLGNVVVNTTQSFSEADMSNIEYGIGVDTNFIKFYINGLLIGSQGYSYPIDFDQILLIGSLEGSNTSINSIIQDFGIHKVLP